MKRMLAVLIVLFATVMIPDVSGVFAGGGMCPMSGKSAVASAPSAGNTEGSGTVSDETADADGDTEASEEAADSAA